MLSYSTQLIEEDDIQAVTETLNGKFLAQGPKVAEFEAALCTYTGAKYAVAFNSATSALSGAYHAAGIKKDDEIITTLSVSSPLQICLWISEQNLSGVM
jgi:UDP-4-amino-4,6-dideoxy-L-N-acetyl-beta-L-altrosamine transaminase